MSHRIVLATLLAAAASATPAPAGDETPYTTLPYTPSLDVTAMDRSIDPCEDLYQYSCGGWQKSNPIPADQASWGVYGKLYVDNQRYLWGILEDAAKRTTDRTPAEQKIGDYFAACMDLDAVEKAGADPLRTDLDRIAAVRSVKDLGGVVGALHARIEGSGLLFGMGSQQDALDSSKVIGALYAGGLGLPDR